MFQCLCYLTFLFLLIGGLCFVRLPSPLTSFSPFMLPRFGLGVREKTLMTSVGGNKQKKDGLEKLFFDEVYENMLVYFDHFNRSSSCLFVLLVKL